MDNVGSNQTSRFLTPETGSISIVPTLKGSDSTLFSCWRVPISRNSVLSSYLLYVVRMSLELMQTLVLLASRSADRVNGPLILTYSKLTYYTINL